MHSDRMAGALRVVAGKFREILGRLVDDPSLQARGRAERLTGEVALACVRVRAIPRH